MKTDLYKTSRMLRKARDILRKHPLHLLLPMIIRLFIETRVLGSLGGARGSFSSLRGIWFGGSLHLLPLLGALLQLLLFSAVIAYTVLRFSAYLQGHSFTSKVLITRTLKKLPRFFVVSILQSLIIIAPLYISFLVLSYSLRRGAVLGVAAGMISIWFLFSLIFTKYIYLLEWGMCPSVIGESWRLVKRIGRRKIANKALGIRGMIALIGIIYGLFILPLFSALLPGAGLLFYPIFAGFAAVWTLGAFTETYLTYDEKLPSKGEDKTSTSFWIATVIILLCYFLAAWMLIMMTSLTSFFLKYGTTTSKSELPQQTFTQVQQTNAQKNIATIGTLFTQEKATTATFSQDDINAMIATVTGAQEVLRVRLQDNLMYIDFSFGLSKVPQRQFADKYLYGTLGFKLQASEQAFQPVEVMLATGSINGKTLPANLMDQIKGKNLTEGMYQSTDMQVQAILERIKSIAIKNNKLSIETKE